MVVDRDGVGGAKLAITFGVPIQREDAYVISAEYPYRATGKHALNSTRIRLPHLPPTQSVRPRTARARSVHSLVRRHGLCVAGKGTL